VGCFDGGRTVSAGLGEAVSDEGLSWTASGEIGGCVVFALAVIGSCPVTFCLVRRLYK